MPPVDYNNRKPLKCLYSHDRKKTIEYVILCDTKPKIYGVFIMFQQLYMYINILHVLLYVYYFINTQTGFYPHRTDNRA